MKNSSYEQRKQIIKPSTEDPCEMYQKAPLRQILSLKIPQLQQIILISFFSHDYDVWKLSINGISKSFGFTKNRRSVDNALKKLKSLGYLKITDYTYQVDIKKINEDYLASIKGKDRDTNDNKVAFEQIVTGDTNNNRVLDTNDNNNNRNIRELDNLKGIKESDKVKLIIKRRI